MAISHYRFRRAYVRQGYDLADLPYKAKWFPLGPLFAFALCMLIMLGQNYTAFTAAKVDWNGVVATYVGIPLFLALWWGYRVKHKTRLVPLEQVDLADAHRKARELREESRGGKLAEAQA